MRFFKKFQKKAASAPCPYVSPYAVRGVPVIIDPPDSVSERHLPDDFAALEREGFDKVVREKFIPWFRGEQFADRDDERIFEGLRLDAAAYRYGRIIADYSPTGEEGFFGQFEFDFVSGSDYTADMLEATAMQVYIHDGRIVRVSGYEI